ncbi:MAG: fumarate hydratase C-terminal domain-containing protein [Spirochaetaceae bacterium]|jgi:fumarate hydratase subunit beta|nr:fumarate hydratase C-terminal domain-containing protein [Spirochaetaceae bacterium]
MNKPIPITAPLPAQTVCSLQAGDIVELSGTVWTLRDAGHKRIADALAAGAALPADFSNALIFYAGPAPAKPGRIIGPIAATTSMRMDGFLEMMYKLGTAGSIGKGGRSAEAAALCKQYRRVYFLSIGGAAALVSRHVRSCEVVAWDDLGAESLKKLEVENLRLVVDIDAQGRIFHDEQIKIYRQ